MCYLDNIRHLNHKNIHILYKSLNFINLSPFFVCYYELFKKIYCKILHTQGSIYLLTVRACFRSSENGNFKLSVRKEEICQQF